ncbi:Flagellar biosynthesis protein FlhA [Buchnera aphidicola (Cinara cf. splendens/pseudotsugae 3390)]|uniref:Flagellar biosynthesis protein FlhA n=2 Tax=Buchnera aphidicola TaxID=9 RepID=A0A451CWQ7_9GAMM|nr:Flagellar biosynthesis protein FlhA [Buchnera aphidicola (Cinara cf. splendens/pseudotsugae 3390)]
MRKMFILLDFIKKINHGELYSLSAPILILVILFMLILPLPSFLLDFLFSFNIVISIIILVVAMFTTEVLDFSSFPTILLFSTLLRLSLNIASTRIILLKGHTGSFSAGHVIESFGCFLIGGNFFIGLVIFVILVIINFFVITKGSGRIAEVGARFILDAMPGKQMAIDADLNTGFISKKEAKIRRMNVYKEADFYGSMDGASKFIRGDAIAGIIIMLVNIIGGLIVGIFQHNMLFVQAVKIYSILTVGDGLVAQIPSLIISIASGVILTRVGSEKISIGKQIINQVFNNPQVIFFSGIIFSIFGVIPGMPNFIFLFFSGSLFLLSWYLCNQQYISKNFSAQSSSQKNKKLHLSWNDIQFERLIVLQLNSRFFQPSYKNMYNDLLHKLHVLRKNIAKNFGFLISEIDCIHDCKLEDGQYKIFIKGVEIESGYVFFDKILAVNTGKKVINIPGIKVKEPVFDLPAFWVDIASKDLIIKKKLLVVEPNSVIVTHLNKIIRYNLHDFFGFQETQQFLDRVSQNFPKLVDYVVPKIISITVLQKILQNLLYDRISIKDIRTIFETLIKHSDTIKNDVNKSTSIIRISLRKFITQKFFCKSNTVCAIGLSAKIENILLKIISSKNSKLEPLFTEKLIKKTKLSIIFQKKNNLPTVLLVHPKIRVFLAKLFITSIPELTVLSFLEISEDRKIKIVYTIGKDTF